MVRSRFVTDFGGSPKRRPARVGDAIKNEISSLLVMTVNDPRLQSVAVTTVEMTADLKIARIFYSCEERKAREAAAGLESAKGFMRSHIARELGLRYVPELVFKRDMGAIHQETMEKLLQEIREENG